MDNTEKQNSVDDFYNNPHISVREKYKYYSQKDPSILAEKEKIRKIVIRKGLSSVMNDTKWLKLHGAIIKLPFPPPYFEKLVIEDKNFEDIQLTDAPEWLGDWSLFYEEGMSVFFAIEYIKVRPRYAEYQGSLVAPKILDETEEFEALLDELHIPYEEDNGTFTIYGYK